MKYVAALLIMLVSGSAMAQTVCGNRNEFLQNAKEKFNEEVVVRMLSSQGVVIEILVNAEKRSYTVVGTAPSGQSCILDSGEGFQVAKGQSF